MNTPAHVMLSLWALPGARAHPLWLPAFIGALLPDVPMFLFYGVESALGTPETVIWGEHYFAAGWQDFFDLFNALPVILLAWFLARLRGSPWTAMLCASMAVHCTADLLLHREDAHRHFFPLSDWRFVSPVSYWDPAHYGLVFLSVELVAVAVGAALLLRHREQTPLRWVGGGTLALYAGFLAFAALRWGPLG